MCGLPCDPPRTPDSVKHAGGLLGVRVDSPPGKELQPESGVVRDQGQAPQRLQDLPGYKQQVDNRDHLAAAVGLQQAYLRAIWIDARLVIFLGRAWLRVNQRLCDILGYSRAELLQKNFQDRACSSHHQHYDSVSIA